MSFSFGTTETNKDRIWVEPFQTLLNLSTNKTTRENTLKDLAKEFGLKSLNVSDLNSCFSTILKTCTAKLKQELTKYKTNKSGETSTLNYFTKEDLKFIAKCVQKLFKNVDLTHRVFTQAGEEVKKRVQSYDPDKISTLSHAKLVEYICDGFQFTIAYVWDNEHFPPGNPNVKKNMLVNFQIAQDEKRVLEEIAQTKKVEKKVEIEKKKEEVKKIDEEVTKLMEKKAALTKKRKKEPKEKIAKVPKEKKEAKATKTKEPKVPKEKKEPKVKAVKEPKAPKEKKTKATTGDKPKKIPKQTKTKDLGNNGKQK
jgi:hypothetical protein